MNFGEKFPSQVEDAKANWESLMQSDRPIVFIGTATCGRSAGAMETWAAFETSAKALDLDIEVYETGCVGLCYAEPMVVVFKPDQPGIVYGDVDPNKAKNILQNYLVAGDPMTSESLGYIGEEGFPGLNHFFDQSVFQHQVRRLLANCGTIDPTRLEHYLAQGGYEGLIRALDMKSDEIIETMKDAGLRGRGGAGFPTWRKWRFCADTQSDQKYLVCNADEGDPGAFMNRALLEGDPHSLIEGMIIAGYAIGADTGYIYCRAEYPLALQRLRLAISQAEDAGYLGKHILGSDFNFKIKIKEGAGAFVCGEETALIASIEGKRGMPNPRPPYPAVSGLWGHPTIINNVETLASVALIQRKGASWFSEFGSEKSKGTKTIALVGKVKNTGLVEVPLGITLHELVNEVGGGIVGGGEPKAVQTGGPSGGCVPRALFDTPVDYDSLSSVGTIMGSGGVVVMDESTCMVDFARFFLDFATKESCGECVPCRMGTKQMLEILTDIVEGRGKPEDLDLLEELGEGIIAGSLCGLGQTAPILF